MRHRIRDLALSLSAAASLSQPALATTISGTHNPGSPDLFLLIGRVDTAPCFFDGCVTIGSGLYGVTYWLSQPLLATLSLGGVEVSDEYDADGQYVGGTEHPYVYGSVTRRRAQGQAILKVPRPFTKPGAEGGTIRTYDLGAVSLEVFSPAQYAYSFDVTRIGNVPEPAIWLQLVIGFGLAGFGFRRRQRSQQTPASSGVPLPA